jgi:Zn-dependent protease with chaperone function
MKNFGTAKENVYYVANLLVSALVLLGLVFLFSGSSSNSAATQTKTLFVTYLAVIVLYVFVAKGLLIGRIRGNAVRISEIQFPEIHAIYKEQLQKLEIHRAPRLYCVQSNGVLNAFATRMLFRNYIVIYSEVLEAAFQDGADAVAFVLAHELGHVKRGHLIKNLFIYPAFVLLPLRMAYSRACEYTSDAIARAFSTDDRFHGLLILAAGKALSRKVDVDEYISRSKEEKGFWVWFAEFNASHPNLPKRIQRLRSLG